MKKRLTMFLAVFFLCMGTALAQTEISGTVISSDDGQPVVGASILVVGTQTGTATDIDGHFSLPVKAGSKITVSYIGMKTQTLTGKAHMKITLDPDGKVMDEVMVVAFGTQSKASFAGSAAVVNSGDLKKKITTNVADALIGSVPGLQLTGGSGAPGAGNPYPWYRFSLCFYRSVDHRRRCSLPCFSEQHSAGRHRERYRSEGCLLCCSLWCTRCGRCHTDYNEKRQRQGKHQC